YIVSEMISDGDTFCSYQFEADTLALRCMIEAFKCDSQLWSDFQEAVDAHRQTAHWEMLLEHVYAVGNLLGKLKLLELGMENSTKDRRRLSERLNCIDGEIGLCQDLADRRDLAARLRVAVGLPVVDGLVMRAITYVLGADAELWRDFRLLMEGPNKTLLN